MHLPPAIKTYFDADRTNNLSAVVDAFSSDAFVQDEGRTHSGPEAIATWWDEAKAKYDHTAEPLEASEHDHVTTVQTRVTGEFPGSPATLNFKFRLSEGKIASLEIGA